MVCALELMNPRIEQVLSRCLISKKGCPLASVEVPLLKTVYVESSLSLKLSDCYPRPKMSWEVMVKPISRYFSYMRRSRFSVVM